MNHFDERPVLIVDDSQMYRTSAARMLTKLGLAANQIVMSSDAAQALMACKTNQFQMIFIDYNLGTKANGYQLLDDIKNRDLLPPDCVVVVITGDASADIVRSFAELNPDCYLIKPLSFNTLKDRVPKLLAQKRALSSILWSIKNENFSQGLDACESVMFDSGEISKHALLLKVQILLLQGDMDAARNLLVSLNATISTDLFSAKLAEIAMAKRHFPMAEYILTSHLERNPNSPKELSLLGELYFRTGKIGQAQKALTNAIELSPTVVDRHWLLLCSYLVNKQNVEAVSCANAIIQHSLHSTRHTLAIYQLGASIIVDNAMSYDFDKREALIKELKFYLSSWRKLFSNNEYKPYELLIMARAYFAVGLHSKGLHLLNEHKELKERSEPGALELAEMMKLAQLVDGFSEISNLTEQFNQSVSLLSSDTHPLIPESIRRYMANWRTHLHSQQNAYELHKRKAKAAVESGNFEVAAELLIEMFFSGVELTFDVPRRLLHTLSKGWPNGMGRTQVAKIALKCKESLVSLDNFPTEAESQILSTLSKQLDYPDLSR